MSNSMEFIARIDLIDPTNRQVNLNGNMYLLGDKIDCKYYKTGDSVNVKVNQYGSVVYMRKSDMAPSTQGGFMPQPQQRQGFVPANQIPPQQPQPPRQFPQQNKDATNMGILWCNSVNSAIEIQKLRCESMTGSEIQELDLVDLVIKDASRLFHAGRTHDGRPDSGN